jgi:tetratricopeptide (TPR) repeat protein
MRMAQIDPWESVSRVRCRDDFVSGLRCFRNQDWEGALGLFRAADDQAEMDDIYQNRYTSYHGLARVHMGDRNGVKLCRKAAVGERFDAEVYYNLAVAEHKLGFRESAYTALRRGLTIDANHAGLKRLKQEFRLREQRALIPGLRRNNILNRILGKLFRGSRKPWRDRDR